ncbi:hypothetical protein EXIGLDRAFT_841596 [Exidia glandulosa HHB12029]|uniref:DUF7918 domain-containing protein n=1 Tax=Exidia glandulosa HHB12029 TaxID=1314781 RepID=A0A165DT05_EXIGL|nr:hypothetical protein EXIGLDRAFT_841596 [Exidia glandulosa HHB12029]
MPAQQTSISHLNFEAWVDCDGIALPVYGVEVNGNKATCWIASQAGKNFAVHFKMNDRSERANYSGAVGRTFGTVPPAHDYAQRSVTAMRPTPTTQRQLRFSSLQTSDDDYAIKDNAILSHLGTILVKFYRVEVEGTMDHSAKPVPAHLDSQQKFTVHEAAKKLGGHHVQLVAPKAVKPYRRTRVRPIGGSIVELEFKYRPQSVLEAQDIIPVLRAQAVPAEYKSRKRPNDATNTDRRVKKAKTEPVDGDALHAAQARIRDLEAQLKKEREGLAMDVKVKAEVEPIRVSGAFSPGQVIDLTDD